MQSETDAACLLADMELGITMARIGIPAIEMIDEQGGQQFISLGLDSERSIRRKDGPDNWFWVYSPTAKEGADCCSDRWVGTHYVTAAGMYAMDDLHLMQCEAAGPVSL
jgi:hypothetical protein